MRADQAAIAEAAAAILRGELVAMPTETVYGLGADATNARAVAAIFAAKSRPAINPLISHVLGVDDAARQAAFPTVAEALAARFWPGPLTMVLDRRPSSSISDLACAGLATVGLRAPAHAVARALIAAVGRPLAAPSANPSGGVSPTTAAHVRADFGAAIANVLDGGPCALGVESTIVRVTADGQLILLRPGAVTRAELAAAAGREIAEAAADARITSPGQLASHYAPHAKVRLDADPADPACDAFLGFGASARPGHPNLSRAGDLAEAAANLFSMLRALDARGPAVIGVASIPADGLGEAILDRLRRAAAPR